MPNKITEFLISEVSKLRDDFNTHIKQSGSIQTHLNINTVLTTGVLVAVLGRLLYDFIFHK